MNQKKKFSVLLIFLLFVIAGAMFAYRYLSDRVAPETGGSLFIFYLSDRPIGLSDPAVRRNDHFFSSLAIRLNTPLRKASNSAVLPLTV